LQRIVAAYDHAGDDERRLWLWAMRPSAALNGGKFRSGDLCGNAGRFTAKR